MKELGLDILRVFGTITQVFCRLLTCFVIPRVLLLLTNGLLLAWMCIKLRRSAVKVIEGVTHRFCDEKELNLEFKPIVLVFGQEQLVAMSADVPLLHVCGDFFHSV